MKDNKFNAWFCKNWPDVKAGLSTWQGIAKNPILKGAIAIVVGAGDRKYAECGK